MSEHERDSKVSITFHLTTSKLASQAEPLEGYTVIVSEEATTLDVQHAVELAKVARRLMREELGLDQEPDIEAQLEESLNNGKRGTAT